MTLEKRIDDLERSINPELPGLLVYWQADRGYWIPGGKPDYRSALGCGAGEKYISEAEFQALCRTHQVFLVRYVPLEHISEIHSND